MCAGSALMQRLLSGFFEYRMQKVVVIRSVKFGLFYRTVQLVVVFYFLFYIVWHKKGYQVKETPQGGVVFKVKGLDFVNHTEARVWDAADYSVPPVMNGAIFITTNAHITERQAMGNCPDYSVSCSNDTDCEEGSFGLNGRLTGVCDSEAGACEGYGWCPAAESADWVHPVADSILERAVNFTVLIKNSVDFRQLRRKRRNILDWMTSTYLATCLHQQWHSNLTYCPVFRLGDILKYAGCVDRQRILRIGGAIGVDISWGCNFDLPEHRCLPEYHFRELDTGQGTDIEGFSIRYAYNYRHEGQQRRMFIRAFGVKIFVTVSGEAGQFDFYSLSMNLGSGLALFGLSSMICDILLLRISSRKQRRKWERARVTHCDIGPSNRSLRRASAPVLRKSEAATVAMHDRLLELNTTHMQGASGSSITNSQTAAAGLKQLGVEHVLVQRQLQQQTGLGTCSSPSKILAGTQHRWRLRRETLI